MPDRIIIKVIDGPLDKFNSDRSSIAKLLGLSDNLEIGSHLRFEGIVRQNEEGRALSAIDYEVYEPMASKMIKRIADALIDSHRLLGMQVEHSRGRVGVGECSFRVHVLSSHRAEGLRALGEFTDRLKRDVPIWKHPVFAEE